MNAIIQIDIPEYQIGQEVSIYFKDTMMIKGVVQELSSALISREDAEECKELMTDINGDTVYVVRMSDIRQLSSVNLQEPKTEKVLKMRDATPEERESVDKYVKSISKPTGVNFDTLVQESMREFTVEEAKAYSKALDKMYKPTGFNVFNEPCDEAISRNDMLDAVGHGTTYTSLEVQKIINGLHSVNPVLCDDAISRQAVLDIVCGTYEKDGWGESNFYKAIKKLPSGTQSPKYWIDKDNKIYKMPDDIPTVTQMSGKYRKEAKRWKNKWLKSQKSGKWILTIEDWNKWTCSKCGYVKRTDIHVNIGWKYCPNCGSYNGGDNNGNE